MARPINKIKNVFYALRANRHISEALREVEKELSWSPSCILAERENLQNLRQQYPGILLIDNREAHIDLNYRYHSLNGFYDHNIRLIYGKYETEVCKNLERILPALYHTHHERLFFFHVWLTYWLEQVDILEPDLAFFVNSPMLPHHFILYLVCVEKRVDVLLGNNIAHPHRLTNFKRRIESLPIGLKQAYQKRKLDYEEQGEPFISSWVKEYFAKNRTYKVPDYLAEKQNKAHPQGAISTFLGVRQSHLWGGIAYLIYGYNVLLKKHHRVAYYLQERAKVRLANYYRRYSTDNPPLDEKFVYLPLHYQPERSTSPDAGIFADQHLIIKTLDRALPNGWKIYVKEHPSQFASYNEGEKGREIADYQEIQRLHSVILVSETFPSNDLIEHSQVVATCTGTAGWEAVLRGIPVFIFGTIWYDLCQGVYRIRSVSQAKEAFDKITNGIKPDELQAKLLADSVAEVSCSLWDGETGAFNRESFLYCLKKAYHAS